MCMLLIAAIFLPSLKFYSIYVCSLNTLSRSAQPVAAEYKDAAFKVHEMCEILDGFLRYSIM